MNLILTSQQRLYAVYGPHAQRVLAALAQLNEARGNQGIVSRLLPVEQGLDELGVLGAVLEPPAIAEQLAQAAGALEQRGEQLESVLIIGGPEIIPFQDLPNPTPLDGDASVPSDACYSNRDTLGIAPEWAVGRLPGAAGRNPALLVRLVQHATLLHLLPHDAGPLRSFGYSAAIWQQAAAQVYAEISDQPLVLSPPTVAATLERAAISGARLIYCNLHGVRDGPLWYGQSEERPGLLVALRPSDLEGLNLRGALVLSEACYGAEARDRNERTSLALAFLASGVAGFVGATAITYGPPGPPLSEADLIALHFLRALKQPGMHLGAAFVAARYGQLNDTLARQTALDDDDQKTALAFVLYGDPTLVVT